MGLSNSHKMMEAKTVEHFDKLLKEAGSALTVVHFWASWAPMCQQMSDVMEILAKDSRFKDAKFVKIEAEAVPVVSQRYEIAAVPTCILLRNGSIVDRVDGANAPELTEKVEKQSKVQPLPAQPKPAESLESRLKKLINAAPVMLFMKGSPGEPKCGFSRTTIEILKDQEAQFKTFDILSDDEVRQGLKKFSDWPTYPQLYISGELIGGLDIIKEMVESGEFKDMLPKQESLDERLKRIINQQKVMLFMKGNPEQPKCGFSKTTIGILQEAGVEYGTFDILGDEEVRQGLKKYSDWPTYPQLYVKGELVGGLDIIKELKEGGELESTLKGD